MSRQALTIMQRPQPIEPQRQPQVADLELRFRILSAEYSHLTSMLAATWSISAARTNLFFVAVSAGGLALGIGGSSSRLSRPFLVLALGVLMLILTMGMVALSRMLGANRIAIRLIQSLNRIRHFFVELDPHISSYLTQSTHDDERGIFGQVARGTSFGAMTEMPAASMASLIALVDAFVTAAIVGVGGLLASGGDLTNALVAAGVTLALGIVLFEGWVYSDLQRARRGLNPEFPS